MLQEHANPDCEYLWQKVRKVADIQNSNPNIWYCNAKIGPNPLASFMSCLSHAADLSRVYTNHSIRVTGTTFLSRNNFSAKQIMSVTGHHSINSLAIYQKVSENEKLCMGMSINYFINSDRPEINAPLQPREQENVLKYRSIAPKTASKSTIVHKKVPTKRMASKVRWGEPQRKIASTSSENVGLMNVPPQHQLIPLESGIQENEKEDDTSDFDLGPNFNILDYMNNLEEDTEITVGSQEHHSTTQEGTITTKQQIQKVVKKSPSTPIFHGCKIGAIHFHVHKN